MLSHQELSNIFSALPDFVFITDDEGAIIEYNTVVKNRAAIKKAMSEYWGKEGQLSFNRIVHKHVDEHSFRSKFFFAGGDSLYAEIIVAGFEIDSKKKFVVTVKDITKQHNEELDLLRFSEVIRHTVNPIQITDAKGKIIYVNPAYERITGYTKEELIGRDPSILNSGKQPKEFWQNAWKVILSGQEWISQVQNKRKNGDLFYTELLISPIIDEAKTVIGFLGAHRDITEQKMLEQQLVRSQKMETFGTLAAGIAHEVGNPLTSISSIVQVILRTTDDAFAKEKLDLVKNQINRITKIIRELVDFSRPSTYDVKRIDVNAILRDAMNIVQYGKKVQHIQFTITLTDNLPSVTVVSDQLVQVFLNILMNAVDACEEGKHTISVHSVLDKDIVHIIIGDTGTGIAETDIEKVFDPFFTTKEVGKGTGLGLWVSLGIIKNFGGDIRVESVLGKGTIFTVLLPLKGAMHG